MLMIEMLIVIACSSLAIALFYSYYKIGNTPLLRTTSSSGAILPTCSRKEVTND